MYREETSTRVWYGTYVRLGYGTADELDSTDDCDDVGQEPELNIGHQPNDDAGASKVQTPIPELTASVRWSRRREVARQQDSMKMPKPNVRTHDRFKIKNLKLKERF